MKIDPVHGLSLPSGFRPPARNRLVISRAERAGRDGDTAQNDHDPGVVHGVSRVRSSRRTASTGIAPYTERGPSVNMVQYFPPSDRGCDGHILKKGGIRGMARLALLYRDVLRRQ